MTNENFSRRTKENMPKGLKGFQRGNKLQLGKSPSKETIEKIRQANKGNTYCLGIKHSKETRDKISRNHHDVSGSKNPKWNGGRGVHSGGYVYIRKPNHPNVTKKGYVFEHRLVMERILGRYLEYYEKVHHKNGKKNDNRPENLILFLEGKNWHQETCPKCGFDFLVR